MIRPCFVPVRVFASYLVVSHIITSACQHVVQLFVQLTCATKKIDVRAQVLSVYDRRNEVGKRVCRLAPLGREQKFIVIAPGLCEPHITDDVLQQIVSEASILAQNRAATVILAFLAAWRVEAFSLRHSLLMGSACCFFPCRRQSLLEHAPH